MEVNSEYMLNVKCAYPDKQLFDWGMMRLRRPPYGVGDPFAMDADDKIRKKRDAEVILYFPRPFLSPLTLFETISMLSLP
jgi:SWI/SNF-related matrix-associated actin-dependent regulator of chromatin subfamily A protein 2/4